MKWTNEATGRTIEIYNEDCLEAMDKLIESGIKIDAIITDPPYGTTACKWDSIIPFDKMWERLNKLIKPNGAIVLFGSEPFSSALRMSNIRDYKYDWIWEKDRGTNFLQAQYQPMKIHENILVFSNNKTVYNPQKYIPKSPNSIARMRRKLSNIKRLQGKQYNIEGVQKKDFNPLKYPESIIYFNRKTGNNQFYNDYIKHSTQKPIALMEYLIQTYTNENELVLDFTMGSGSTGVACMKTNRNFIGIELDKDYFEATCKRLDEHFRQGVLF